MAVQIYKHTILPYFDYGFFLCISLSKDKKHDLQVMHNDILRICNKSKLSDKISIEHLHKKIEIIKFGTTKRKAIIDVDVYSFETQSCA